MIPLRLTVKNFMCYRDDVPTLHLENLRVACLCGDNGHGKSALLDAITWALWGKARAATQQELIHQGRQDMEVKLEFLARGREYRVLRKYSRSARNRQGTSILEFQVASDAMDVYRPITGNSVRETEALIRETLHMDYDTFVNTAFLLQGQADLFTRNSPARRKEFLAEVLDLSYYEELEERAKARSRDIQNDVGDAEGQVALRQPEIARKPEYEQKLADTDADIARLAPEAEAQRLEIERLGRDISSLKAKRLELETLTRRLANAQDDIAHLERQASSHQARLDEYDAVAQRDTEIRKRHASLVAGKAKLEELNRALASKGELDRRKSVMEREIAVQGERLSAQLEQLSNATQQLELEAGRIPEIEESLVALAGRRAQLGELELAVQERRKEAEEASAELERLNQALEVKNGLDQKKAELERRIAVQAEGLRARVNQLSARIFQQLQPQAERVPGIEEQIRATNLEEQKLSEAAKTIRGHQDEWQQIALRVQNLQQSNEGLLREMEDTKQKFVLLGRGDTLCPLCNQPVGEDGTEHLRREYESRGLEARRQYQENDVEHKTLTKKQADLKSLISRLEAERDTEGRRIQGKFATLKRELEESRAAHVELEPAREELEQLETRVNTGHFARQEQEELSLLEQELAALGYDPEKRSLASRRANEINVQVTRLESEFNSDRQNVQSEQIRLERDLVEARKAEEELQTASLELERVGNIVRTEDFAHGPREGLARLDNEVAALGYDAEAHAAVGEQVSALDEYDDLHRKLLEAHANLPVERKSLEESRRMLMRRQQEALHDEERKAALGEELEALPALEAQLEESKPSLREFDNRLMKAEVAKGILEGQIAHCVALQAESRAQEERRGRLIDEKGVYDELAVAFGKNGIQALVIESAIPQLQNDANELLVRLTENRMSLKLELNEGRLDRRAGIRAEELEIKIADEVGTRSYETFSGGEAFRVNFALRIALSKLLARRSGAPLPILFIDEGFGSQDTAGQERLTQAIKSIEDDFQKIIVITHVEQIKEAFPVRIEVTKDGGGSSFRIV